MTTANYNVKVMEAMDCTFSGCTNRMKTRRLCATHYWQLMNGKQLLPVGEHRGLSRRGKEREPLANRFWRRVRKTESCWLWQGAKAQGYGMMHVLGRGLVGAHRVSWFLAHGAWPDENLWMCHHCDTPACVRPEHLFPGTPSDNGKDMVRKGRGRNGSSP